MLNPKVDYRGKKVIVFNTKFKAINDKEYKILNQYPDERGGLIFELNILHPESKKGEALCIKESECSIINL